MSRLTKIHSIWPAGALDCSWRRSLRILVEPLVTLTSYAEGVVVRDRSALNEFEFLRGELFFQQALTFSLAATGFHAILDPESLVDRHEKYLFTGIEGLALEGTRRYTLGGLIIEGKVCGSILKALEVAEAVKGQREVNRVAFEEDSFSDPHETVPPFDDNAGSYRRDINDYMKDVASVCIVGAFELIKDRLKKGYGNVLEWPPDLQYLRHLRNGASHGNKFTMNKPKIDQCRPPSWRTSVMISSDAMEGKQLFNNFLRPGDIPVLLSDIQKNTQNCDQAFAGRG